MSSFCRNIQLFPWKTMLFWTIINKKSNYVTDLSQFLGFNGCSYEMTRLRKNMTFCMIKRWPTKAAKMKQIKFNPNLISLKCVIFLFFGGKLQIEIQRFLQISKEILTLDITLKLENVRISFEIFRKPRYNYLKLFYSS